MAAERNTFSSIRDKDRRTKAGSASHAERPCDLTRLLLTPRGASRAGLCLGHASGLLALQPSPFRGQIPRSSVGRTLRREDAPCLRNALVTWSVSLSLSLSTMVPSYFSGSPLNIPN